MRRGSDFRSRPAGRGGRSLRIYGGGLRYGGRRLLRVAAIVLRRSGGGEARREARLRCAQQVPRVHQGIVAAGGREPPRILGQRIRHFSVGVRLSRGLILWRCVRRSVAAELREDIGGGETRQRCAADEPPAERIVRQIYRIAPRVIAALRGLVTPPRADSHPPQSRFPCLQAFRPAPARRSYRHFPER